jgi:prepilin-type N-terminal cleavage/methylation domain-containing protein
VSSSKLERVRKKLPRNNQTGFTLIELLVVISILGILAAVVTMSLVGITTNAQNKANSAEAQTVQTALDTMLADNNLTAASVCPAGPSTNMTAFPGTGATALSPGYIRQASTKRAYSCDSTGQISPPP